MLNKDEYEQKSLVFALSVKFHANPANSFKEK